ncbi:MAG TPA: hypothetical protein VE974_29910 [Thermoanaerobaculia bacterium]|nr:hypothetical protein [Thermoanaerobaculia bacterium]
MRTALLISALLLLSAHAPADEPPAGLQRLEFMIGTWQGTSSGEPGNGTIERECTRVLNDRFVECRTTVTYPAQEQNPKGEVHVERSIYSFDKKAKKLRLRQFHGEGFVNSYVEAAPLTFETVEIENIPAGWRARETYEQASADAYHETFALAEPGKELAVYSRSTLKRVK